ncbi:hypothetical protein EPI10_034396 [Gossypium australe]|uniref:Reverse transcriptase n=1 Tax=Gossypium australe TaxID=47621 RepID=A0A5B6U541_9ROSI|nr:hypothetical protein EPI10_034396 [Gossypium australe]
MEWINLFPEYTRVNKKKTRFRFKAWWAIEDSCEEEVKQLWEQSRGSIMVQLTSLGKFLQIWTMGIKKLRKDFSRRLLARIEELDALERTDENLAELIDTKIQLNWEIEKKERY